VWTCYFMFFPNSPLAIHHKYHGYIASATLKLNVPRVHDDV